MYLRCKSANSRRNLGGAGLTDGCKLDAHGRVTPIASRRRVARARAWRLGSHVLNEQSANPLVGTREPQCSTSKSMLQVAP